MLQHLLSIIILLNMLMSPVAVECQFQSNTTPNNFSPSMTHDRGIMDNAMANCDCCDTQCIHCLCGCLHLFQASLSAAIKLYQISPSTTEFPSIITDIVNDTQPPELPPPLV